MELSPICKKEYPALRALYRSAFPARHGDSGA